MLRQALRPLPLALVVASALPVGTVAAQTLADGQDATSLAREVTVLRTELRQQQDLVLLLRHRLAESEASAAWLPWLLLGLVVALVLAAWLGIRGRRGRGPSASRKRGQRTREGEPSELGAVSAFARAAGDDVAGPATVFAPGAAVLMQQESSTELAQISTHGLVQPAAAAAAAVAVVAHPETFDSRGPGQGLAPPVSIDEPLLAAPVPAQVPVADTDTMGHAAGLAGPAHTKNQQPVQSLASPGRGLASAEPASSAPTPLTPPSRAAEPPVRPAEVTMAGPAVRAMSVDELFDLDQQVDFFLALGQAESAVDLLVSHIRGTGGNSALPYLKLMEVYRQQADADSYERTRKRFNQRFNAHAPDWSGHPEAGRHLEEYPEVLERLQRVWANPLDALAELEALLFRRSRGELFDLPAFRDVLLLHGVAVDQHERSPMSASKVDILLPLTDPANSPLATLANLGPAPGVAAGLAVSPAPALASAPAPTARGLLAGWAGLGMGPGLEASSLTPHQNGAVGTDGSVGKPRQESFSLDLDLSDFAPAPREYTHPAAFTDLDLRGPFNAATASASDVQPKPSPG